MKQKPVLTRLYVCARWNLKPFITAENCANTRIPIFTGLEIPHQYAFANLNLKAALADLDKATTLKPQHAGAHECLGDALTQAGKEMEAAIQYRLAEELRKRKSNQ